LTAVGTSPKTWRLSSAVVMCKSRAIWTGLVPSARRVRKTASSRGEVSRGMPPGSPVR